MLDLSQSSSLPQPDSRAVQHNYGTRIRQNSVIKPSARLRQSPDPPQRKIKPTSRTVKSSSLDLHQQHLPMPVFPPPRIVLHPEDASSKVFLAIGRCFLSVDNCAMTIKDLAEMTLKFGLMCQNVSAAGQAITTYIRTHMQRCDAQQDHPLLMRHTLSGTPSDDDLLPALHSRSGGAHSTLINAEHRATNFRRGTMVWYLSRATGAPCPFARAGIPICEYNENGWVGPQNDSKERKAFRDRPRRIETCGQKRKRFLRGSSSTDYDSDSTNEVKPPPKVRLTLRLKPCLAPARSTSSNDIIDLSNNSNSVDGDRDFMSVDSSSSDDDDETKSTTEPPWSLPPYPRRSISIPCYTPVTESPYSHFPTPSIPGPSPNGSFRRSPSVPCSIASPPPNSEDEDDDYHITMTGSRRCSTDRLRDRAAADADLDWDLDFESDGEGDGETETQWESPGPRSPSAPISNGLMADPVMVKQESRDVQGMLDAWEDFDCGVADGKLLAKAAPGIVDAESTSQVKIEVLDNWDWPAPYLGTSPDWAPPTFGVESVTNVKQEEFDLESLLLSPYEPSHASSISPLSTPFSHYPPSTSSIPIRRHSEVTWRDADSEEGIKKSVRARAQTSASLPSFAETSTSSAPPQHDQLPSTTPTATVRVRDSDLPRPQTPVPSPSSSSFLASLLQSMNMSPLEPQNDTIAPSSLLISPSDLVASQQEARNAVIQAPDVVVVHTCQPCSPPVSATQVEGISVYQMTLGSSSLLRRIDTDFVNMSTIAHYLCIPPPPPSTISNAVVISKGSSTVSGAWVPLTSAREFVREHPFAKNLLEIFLSDTLFERFPPALQDFHRTNAPGRLLNQFGPHFSSTILEVQRQSQLSLRTDLPLTTAKQQPAWGREPASEWDIQDDLNMNSVPRSSTAAAAATPILPISLDEDDIVEPPLSATEQEMFQVLCSIPDWEKEKENSPPLVTATKAVILEGAEVNLGLGLEEAAAANVGGMPYPPKPQSPQPDRPLRRSKRVANANATAAIASVATVKTRAGSRRSARNSLN